MANHCKANLSGGSGILELRGNSGVRAWKQYHIREKCQGIFSAIILLYDRETLTYANSAGFQKDIVHNNQPSLVE